MIELRGALIKKAKGYNYTEKKVITEEVKVLRDECDLPGMKIIQFGFDTGEAWKGCLVNSFLPHNYSNSRAILVTTIQTIVNGHSYFGMRESGFNYPIGRRVDV